MIKKDGISESNIGYNRFFTTLKVAQIIPVYKNSKFDCANYRSILMLSQLSKILEKYLLNVKQNFC